MPVVYYPHTVQPAEPAEHEITWHSKISSLGTILGRRWQTDKELRHISNPACGDLRNRTQALHFLDFCITDVPTVISGVSLRILAQRNGRITDEQIQLTYKNQAIGVNHVNYITDTEGHLPLGNDTTYGGPTDLWEADITAEMLQDPSFGVILKFQSHPYYPHSCGMMLDAVTLTVY